MCLLGEEQTSEQPCGPSSAGDWRNCVVVSHLRYWAVRCMLLVEVNIGRERKNGCFFMYMGVFKNRGTPK